MVTKQDIMEEVHRYQRVFNRTTSFTDDELNALVDEAKMDSYWIKNEGIWAWVFIKLRIKEGRK